MGEAASFIIENQIFLPKIFPETFNTLFSWNSFYRNGVFIHGLIDLFRIVKKQVVDFFYFAFKFLFKVTEICR